MCALTHRLFGILVKYSNFSQGFALLALKYILTIKKYICFEHFKYDFFMSYLDGSLKCLHIDLYINSNSSNIFCQNNDNGIMHKTYSPLHVIHYITI